MKTDNTKTTNNKTADNGYKTMSNGKTTGSGQRTAGTTRSTTEGEFHNFFVEQLKDIYWAEKHLKKGLKKMSRAATSPKLRDAFEKHYNEGDKQIAELETIFGLMGEKPETKRCEAMAGLLEEADGMISDTQRNSFVRDAGLILAAQKVEHYEIATYGTLNALAAYLPEKKVKKMIETILNGEKKTDEMLTCIAEEFVNECAAVE
ncbi:ferritin-like domain-containing protein [uncultured Alistipes sp.]|uniref:YciE/YciF ferroxidase family protein n=1 Tax=uncultured Alistipes sp. TaxID=538949 RepID=UPI00272A8B67|nr:ferritin-like domain-containing protein [uncultured Alistipes sp.]